MAVVEPVVWHGDGREAVVLNHILQLPHLDEIRGNPDAILFEMDKWSAENKILMTIDPDRSDLVVGLITQSKPKVMVELGGYLGYSAIKFGHSVRSSGGQRYLSLEKNPEYAAAARTLIELAELQDFVQLIIGPSSESLIRLSREQPSLQIDMLFIDHTGYLYFKDLEVAEEHCLLSPGALVIADNICDPTAHDYVVRMQGKVVTGDSSVPKLNGTVTTDLEGVFESQTFDFKLKTGEQDGIMVSRRIQNLVENSSSK